MYGCTMYDCVDPQTRSPRSAVATSVCCTGTHKYSYPIIDCVISYSSHLQDVPSALLIPWRTVVADVLPSCLTYILQARRTGDADALEHGLKWHLAIH